MALIGCNFSNQKRHSTLVQLHEADASGQQPALYRRDKSAATGSAFEEALAGAARPPFTFLQTLIGVSGRLDSSCCLQPGEQLDSAPTTALDRGTFPQCF